MYSSSITSAGLRTLDSKTVAKLLLAELSKKQWDQRILRDNVLQLVSVKSRKRIASILRARLMTFDRTLWQMIVEGDHTLSTQATLAAAIKHSRLLGDFMLHVLKVRRQEMAEHLYRNEWNNYLVGCRVREPKMPNWSETTIAKLRTTVFSILCESGYLSSTQHQQLQTVYVDRQLVGYLRESEEHYVLRCLEVAE